MKQMLIINSQHNTVTHAVPESTKNDGIRTMSEEFDREKSPIFGR